MVVSTLVRVVCGVALRGCIALASCSAKSFCCVSLDFVLPGLYVDLRICPIVRIVSSMVKYYNTNLRLFLLPLFKNDDFSVWLTALRSCSIAFFYCAFFCYDSCLALFCEARESLLCNIDA